MYNDKQNEMETEGDAWFERNHVRKENEISIGCRLFETAMKSRLEKAGEGFKILEIGCSSGYNLIYLCEKYHIEGYGIDPSKKAIEYGNGKIEGLDIDIFLRQGTADDLIFENDAFDIVILAFCMYCMDRKYILKAVSEVDRVLRDGGMVVIWDFETSIPYTRPNIHHKDLWTFKHDISKFFTCNPQYTLIEKRSFSNKDKVGFTSDIQERCALNILYKEQLEEAYIIN